MSSDNGASAKTMIKSSNKRSSQIDTDGIKNNNIDENGHINKKKKNNNKQIRKKDMNPDTLKFRHEIQLCCKTDNLQKAIDMYNVAIQNNTFIEAQTYYNLLNLSDGLHDRPIHIGTPKTNTITSNNDDNKASSEQRKETIDNNDDDAAICNGKKDDDGKNTTALDSTEEIITPIDTTTRRQFAERVKERMDELSIPLVENPCTALIRLYSRTNAITEAEKILNIAESTQQCKVKLRMYTPLLTAYSTMLDGMKLIRLWLRISKQDLVLSEREYITILEYCVNTGDYIVMERVLSDLAEDILVPCNETVKLIKQWFQSKHAIISSAPKDNNVDNDDNKQKIEILKQIKVPYASTTQQPTYMGPVQCPDDSCWVISDACTIDANTGILQSGCLQGEKLQPVQIPDTESWNNMKDMNVCLATTGKLSPNDTTEYQGGGKGRKRPLDDVTLQKRLIEWNKFQDYLDKLNNVDIVIDGANVGYFQTNFEGAPKHVNYEQIDWIVNHFIKMNKSILLIMHQRHFINIPTKYNIIVQKWDNILYQTPPNMNDDWFWLHAALQYKNTAMVVTNDEMRDHHFQMVTPRSFIRWKDRYQIHFDFGKWNNNNDNNNNSRDVILKYPDPYSRRIQRINNNDNNNNGLVIPLVKKYDINRFLDGTFQMNDAPIDETYLCIRQVKKKTEQQQKVNCT